MLENPSKTTQKQSEKKFEKTPNTGGKGILRYYILGILVSTTMEEKPPVTARNIKKILHAWGYDYTVHAIYTALAELKLCCTTPQFKNILLQTKRVRAGDSRATGYCIEFKT